jgi:hypothetical protein
VLNTDDNASWVGVGAEALVAERVQAAKKTPNATNMSFSNVIFMSMLLARILAYARINVKQSRLDNCRME